MYGRIPAVHPAPRIDSMSHLHRSPPQAFGLASYLYGPPTSATRPCLQSRGSSHASRENRRGILGYRDTASGGNARIASPIYPDHGTAAAATAPSAQS